MSTALASHFTMHSLSPKHAEHSVLALQRKCFGAAFLITADSESNTSSYRAPLRWDGGVWPKFGFRPARDIAAQFEQFAAELHERKTGSPLPSPVPIQGPDILAFNGVYGVEVGVAALQTFPGLVLELDLIDPVTIDFLTKRGITVP